MTENTFAEFFIQKTSEFFKDVCVFRRVIFATKKGKNMFKNVLSAL